STTTSAVRSAARTTSASCSSRASTSGARPTIRSTPGRSTARRTRWARGSMRSSAPTSATSTCPTWPRWCPRPMSWWSTDCSPTTISETSCSRTPSASGARSTRISSRAPWSRRGGGRWSGTAGDGRHDQAPGLRRQRREDGQPVEHRVRLGSPMPTYADRAAAFRALHERPGAFIIPNPWDAGTAKLLASLGFEALATTSLGFANSLGRVDGTNTVTRDEVLANCRMIATATDLPVNADLENGYADEPRAAAEMIRLAANAGVVGGSIEDATGNPAKPIYDFALAVERVHAAVE